MGMTPDRELLACMGSGLICSSHSLGFGEPGFVNGRASSPSPSGPAVAWTFILQCGKLGQRKEAQGSHCHSSLTSSCVVFILHFTVPAQRFYGPRWTRPLDAIQTSPSFTHSLPAPFHLGDHEASPPHKFFFLDSCNIGTRRVFTAIRQTGAPRSLLRRSASISRNWSITTVPFPQLSAGGSAGFSFLM